MKHELKFIVSTLCMWIGAAGPRYDFASFAVSWCCFTFGVLTLHRMVRA